MTMNIGSTAEEQKRIDTLIEFMGELALNIRMSFTLTLPI